MTRILEDRTNHQSVREFTDRHFMKFNKCKVLCFGWKKPWHWYRLENNWQGYSSTEKNMWVRVESKLDMNEQSTLATMKPNSTLHCINKSLASRLRKIIVSPYPALIRPHLEHCNPFGAQQHMKNYTLELAQQRSTKMAHEKCCEDRIRICLALKKLRMHLVIDSQCL